MCKHAMRINMRKHACVRMQDIHINTCMELWNAVGRANSKCNCSIAAPRKRCKACMLGGTRDNWSLRIARVYMCAYS